MHLTDVIMARKSVRRFSPAKVPLGYVDQAIELARKCPSAGGIRGYEVTVTDKLDYYDAPLHVVVSVDVLAYEKKYGNRGVRLYAMQDPAVFAAYLQLTLLDMGLSTCWIGAFTERTVMDKAGTTKRPVVVLAVGYKE